MKSIFVLNSVVQQLKLFTVKRLLALIVFIVIGTCIFAQTTDNTPPADFAIVDLAGIRGNNSYTCIVKYSDGKEFSLNKVLDMSVIADHPVSQYEMDKKEFKILEYLYDKGYDLQSVSHDNSNTENVFSVRFYFKRKGL